jgi:transposase
MIGSTRQLSVFAHPESVDMRKGFDGLGALVASGLGRDPLSGDLFLFVSRDRRRAKVLLWDGTGLCIYAKRLEEGRFADLARSPRAKTTRLTLTELQLFLGKCSPCPVAALRDGVSLHLDLGGSRTLRV